jgi:hypothetical protein
VVRFDEERNLLIRNKKITNKLTPWTTVLREKLTGPQLLKKSLAFHGTRRFITAFTTACPYPEPDPPSLCLQPSPMINFNIILPSTPGSSVSVPQVSPLKPRMHLYSPHSCYMPCPSVFLTCSPDWYLVRNTRHKAPCYVALSTPLLLCPSEAQISSTPYSRKPSAYIPPSM